MSRAFPKVATGKTLLGVGVSLIVVLGIAGVYLYGYTPYGAAYSYLTVPRKPVHGTIEVASFAGDAAGREVHYVVYRPPGYETSQRRYATLYHLHGLTPAPREYVLGILQLETSWLAHALEEAVAAGFLAPAIIVSPYDGHGASMWSDGRGGGIVAETLVIEDLIPHVDQRYRTVAARSHRIVQGFSMGGFGAVKNAMKFPELFVACVNYDGALHDWPSLSGSRAGIANEVFGDAAYYETYSPWALASNPGADTVQYRSNIGLLRDLNQKFSDLLERSGLDHEYAETACVHDMACLIDAAGPETFRFIGESIGAEPSDG